jgi:hypothetical protein
MGKGGIMKFAYLVHDYRTQNDFAFLDKEGAKNFAERTKNWGITKVIAVEDFDEAMNFWSKKEVIPADKPSWIDN